MATVSHHRHKAAEFLHRTDRAIASRDPTEAASALCRAASHVTTALAVHYGCKHNSRRRLEFALHVAIADERLSRGHLQTFRQTYTLPAALASGVSPASIMLRRMRRRVSALIASVKAILVGDPKPVRHNKLWQRRPDLADVPDFTHVRDVVSLPNYLAIKQRFRLHRVSLSAQPDPHDWYSVGEQPRPCSCHPDLWREPKREPSRITISPLWRKALEKTFRIKLPPNHQLAC